MEAVPDMDDLLDEMEANLVQEVRKTENIAKIEENPGKTVKIAKFLPNSSFPEELEGEVQLEVPEQPASFKPKPIIPEMPQEAPAPKIAAQAPEPEADSELDEMLDYLNKFEDKPEKPQDIREIAGKFAEEFMEKVAQDLEVAITQKINNDTFYEEESSNSVEEREEEAESSMDPETQDLSISDEDLAENLVEVEAENPELVQEEVAENPPESSENSDSQTPESSESSEIITVIEKNLIEEKEEEQKTCLEQLETDKESEQKEEEEEAENEEIIAIMQQPEEIPPNSHENPEEKPEELLSQEEEEEAENRPRFDSSIATIHVLHDADSDDSPSPHPPRARRLTESELQLGKTQPYWIPDSECTLCMLCQTKFTILTRRHHCRACGRVLCGTCCSEKAVLEYLQEEGKKNQAVRVCQRCHGMLERISEYEQEEQQEEPKGVLKTRPEETNEPSSSGGPGPSSGATSRKGVTFRDGVRPGTCNIDEEANSEEKSSAPKPKKKSRKRNSVVKRCAELRMEDELTCALPKNSDSRFLTWKNEELAELGALEIWEKLKDSEIVTIVLKKNLNCSLQIVKQENDERFWGICSEGFAQIGLDEVFFAWDLSQEESDFLKKIDSETEGLEQEEAWKLLPVTVLHRISAMYASSTDAEFAGVRRVATRFSPIHTVPIAAFPLPKNILFFRPTTQDFSKFRTPSTPFLVACFLQDEEVQWANACPNRVLNRLGLEFSSYPNPIFNKIGRKSMYSMQTASTVLKVFTDFRSWSYRMKYLSGCTVSLTNDKTLIRIPRAMIGELREVISWNRSMIAWRCDISPTDDSLLICDENDGFYTTQVFAKQEGKRDSTSANFVILDGGSKVNSLQVNVVEDGVAIRVQNERLETILTAMQSGNNVIESSKNMEFCVEFFDDDFELQSDFLPKSDIDGRCLLNKFQYGLSLERALTQVLQIQGISDYGVRLSHVFNLSEGRLEPDEEPKIYTLVEISARECVIMLEPYIRHLIATDISSLSIRFFVSQEQVEYDVSPWIGLEDENLKFRQSLDQLIPTLYNMTEIVPNGFEVEMVLSIVSTRPLPI